MSKDVKGTINEKAHTVTIEVPPGTDKTKLKASFKISDKAQLFIGTDEQKSGETVNDFSNVKEGVKYTVKAEDGSTQDYIVTVYGIKKDTISISQFGFKKADNTQLPADVDNQTNNDPAQTVVIGTLRGKKVIIMKLPIGTPKDSLATLKPYFDVPAEIELYAGNTKLVSGSTPVDFSDLENGVIIKAIASDGGSLPYNAVVEIDLPKAPKAEVEKYFGSYYAEVNTQAFSKAKIVVVLEENKVTMYSTAMSMDYENVEWEKKADGTYICTTYTKQKPQIKNLYGKGGYDFTEEGGKTIVKTNIMGTPVTLTKGDAFTWTAESGYKPVTEHI